MKQKQGDGRPTNNPSIAELMRTVILSVQRAGRQKLPHVLGIVSLFVRFEDGRSRERLPAQTTPKRPFTGMDTTVVLHVMSQFKRFPAKLALERSIARMGGQVSDQRGHVRKRFTTKLAQHHTARLRGRFFHVHGSRFGSQQIVRIGRFLSALFWPTSGRLRQIQRRYSALFPILERLQRVTENVPGQFALVGERGAAVHALVDSGRRSARNAGVVVEPLLRNRH